MGGVKNTWGSNIYYYITKISLLHFFRNSQHPEKWSVLLKKFSGKLELEIYSFSFRKEFLETLFKCIYLGF